MTPSQEERDPIEELADSFLNRFRAGERPSVEEYAAKHPELAAQVRELLAALVLIEEQCASCGPSNDSPASWRPLKLQRLGEFFLLREVGRGGMGVVYEAVQESLGRHVALKILPPQPRSRSAYLERFRREARSAARLHHTNIVPVFGVGECEGTHYYAMQFIHGQGLDHVLSEVRKVRASPHAVPAGPSLASRLVAGSFDGEVGDLPANIDAKESVTPAPLSSTQDFSRQPEQRYFRAVARLFAQAADAIHYAHQQGVLHRDIKPSNMLLDVQGTLWITDFGLAKSADAGELTADGDILGTLRYMAPERFAGKSDQRSDTYALGVSLYEMLTLQPPFSGSDRPKLVDVIRTTIPRRPRLVEPRLPRDLETIVLKAMAREPAARYTHARDLAEDLRSFLADRPIRARRSSLFSQFKHWRRRNPVVATLSGVVALLVLTVAVVASALSWRLDRALTVSEERRELVIQAEGETNAKLWDLYLTKAQVVRMSRKTGQRFDALRAIRSALQLPVPKGRSRKELRDAALAALALPDLEVAEEWDGCPEGTAEFAFDADFRRYARQDRQGIITICRRSTTGEEVLLRFSANGKPPFGNLRMSPDGEYVACAVHFPNPGSAAFRVWHATDSVAKLIMEAPIVPSPLQNAVALQSDWQRLAVGHPDGSVSVYELPAGRRVWHEEFHEQVMSLAFHPTGDRLAVAFKAKVKLMDLGRCQELRTWELPEGITPGTHVAWHPGGRRIAAGAGGRIHVWDAEAGIEHTAFWEESSLAGGTYFGFNHAGDRMVSSGWDGQTHFWDGASGRLLLTLPTSVGLQFSRDDTLLGCERVGTKLRIYRVAAGREVLVLRPWTTKASIGWPRPHPDCRTLASVAGHRLLFFDMERGEETEALDGAPAFPGLDLLGYAPNQGWLAASGGQVG